MLLATLAASGQQLEPIPHDDPPLPPAGGPVIVGTLPGESIPAPVPQPERLAPPRLDVPARNTVTSRTYDRGDHSITIEKVRPVLLPAPPETSEMRPPDLARQAAFRQLLANRPRRELVCLSATVYDHRATLLRWSGSNGRTFEAWSNIDFNLMRGVGAVKQGDTEHYLLYLGLGNVDTVRLAAQWSKFGRSYWPPAIPTLPPVAETQPTLLVTKGDPTSADLNALNALHELYRMEHSRLKASHEWMCLLNAQLAAERLSNPPKPPDLIIKSWRVSGQASIPAAKGDSQ